MSLQNSTSSKKKVSCIVDEMLRNDDEPNTEVLIYFNEEDNEWEIIKDKRFFSYGLKIEDKVAHLEKLVKMCYNQMSRINEMNNIVNIKGIVRDVAWELNDGMLKYKHNEIEWSK